MLEHLPTLHSSTALTPNLSMVHYNGLPLRGLPENVRDADCYREVAQAICSPEYNGAVIDSLLPDQANYPDGIKNFFNMNRLRIGYDALSKDEILERLEPELLAAGFPISSQEERLFFECFIQETREKLNFLSWCSGEDQLYLRLVTSWPNGGEDHTDLIYTVDGKASRDPLFAISVPYGDLTLVYDDQDILRGSPKNGLGQKIEMKLGSFSYLPPGNKILFGRSMGTDSPFIPPFPGWLGSNKRKEDCRFGLAHVNTSAKLSPKETPRVFSLAFAKLRTGLAPQLKAAMKRFPNPYSPNART